MVTTADMYLAFIVSFIVVTLIAIIVHYIVKAKGGDIFNIIRGDYWVPSLSLFQFFVWTLVIAFSFFGIYILRIIFAHEYSAPVDVEHFPANILLLMGISTAVPIISLSYTRKEYEIPEKTPEKLPPFSMMLQQKGKITLSRFQMFLWTWIGIIIYLLTVFGTVSDSISSIASLTLPDADPVLVALMGLSQSGYLGGRFVTEDKSKKKKETKEKPVEKPVKPESEAEDSASPEKRTMKIRRMSDEVREFLVTDHDAGIRDKILERIDEAEFKEFFRYYIVGDDFYYLIENGQIRGAGRIPRAASMNKINLEKEQIGHAELLKIE